MQLFNDNNLKQYVEEPTRGPNILDLVLSTEDELIDQVTIKEKNRRSPYYTVSNHCTSNSMGSSKI